jgi:hypothetical protein
MTTKPPPPSAPRKKVTKRKVRKKAKRRKGQGIRPPGRPHECTPRVIDRIVEACGVLAPWTAAAAYAGKSVEAVYGWLARGREACQAAGLDPDALPEEAAALVEKGEQPFVQLLQRTTCARAEMEVSLLAGIALHAKGGQLFNAQGEPVGAPVVSDWRAGSKLLAIRNPEHYAEKRRHEISAPDGAPLEVQIYMPELESEDEG